MTKKTNIINLLIISSFEKTENLITFILIFADKYWGNDENELEEHDG